MDESIKKQLEAFFSGYREQSYRKGEILVRADENPSGIFFLEEGTIKEYAISRKGEELIVNIFKPHAFFPMSWAINETRNRYFFEALGPVTLRKAPREEVIAFLKREPDVMFDLLSRLYRGTDGLLTRMVYLMSGSAYARLITELLITAKRFGERKANDSIVSILSETDLAMRAGLTRETVSREMKLLKDKGLVEIRRNEIVVPDLAKLEEELAGDF